MLEFVKEKYSMKIENLKDFVIMLFVLVSDLYEKYTPTEIQHRNGVKRMIMSDVEIITISIAGELMSIDSERAWYGFCRKNLTDIFPRFCERSRFNRLHRNLHGVIQNLYEQIAKFFLYCDLLVIDSLPVPVCKFGRAHFHKSFRGYGACYGRCASKKETYFGYKLHLLCTVSGFPVRYMLSPANVDDRKPVAGMVHGWDGWALLADKGYNGLDFHRDLLDTTGVHIFPLPKSTSPLPESEKALRQFIFRVRRRVETLGSQLVDQLNLQRVRAKSLWGLRSRLASKFLAFALAFLMNLFLDFKEPASIKHLLFL